MPLPALRSSTGPLGAGPTMVVVGIALVTLAELFHGPVRGLLQGSGLASILLGVAVLGARHQRRDAATADRRWWLPSRDERSRP